MLERPPATLGPDCPRHSAQRGQPQSTTSEIWGFRLHSEELIRSEGETVSRAELERKLWPHAQRIHIQRRLNTAVRALREALGDNASEPRLVRTVRGCGYPWIGSECRTIRNVSALPMAAAAALALLTASPASFAPNSHPNSSGLSVETELSSRLRHLIGAAGMAGSTLMKGDVPPHCRTSQPWCKVGASMLRGRPTLDGSSCDPECRRPHWSSAPAKFTLVLTSYRVARPRSPGWGSSQMLAPLPFS